MYRHVRGMHYLLAILIGIALLLGWTGYTSYQKFVEHENVMARQAVMGAASQIKLLLKDLRQKLYLLSYSHEPDIRNLLNHPDDEEAYFALARRVRAFLPEQGAFTVASVSGDRVFFDDLGERIGPLCRQSMHEFSRSGFKQNIMIHPEPSLYHFDVMLPVNLGRHTPQAIFFASFPPTALARILEHAQHPAHKLFLLRTDSPGLVEVSANGGRDVISRPTHLSAAEMKRLSFQLEIPDTRWVLVDLPSTSLFSNEKRRLWQQGLSMFFLLVTVIALALWTLRRADKALHSSEESYDTLVDSVKGVALELDPINMRVLAISPQIENLLGYPGGQWLDEAGFWRRRLYAEDRIWVEERFRRVAREGSSADMVFRMIGASGRVIWLRCFLRREREFDGRILLKGILIDTSEQKQTERELEVQSKELVSANRELEAFSYSVSHDLRAPVRSINNFAHVLLEDYGEVLDETAKDYIQRLIRAGQRMGELIDDLLALSRVGRQPLNIQQVNLSEEVKEICNELQAQAPERPVEFTIEKQIIAEADLVLIRAVLRNLLENAWKFTAEKALTEIQFNTQQNVDGTIYRLCDNGIGFGMEYAEKIFDVFQRLHSQDEYEGTGIGLSTVQRIIQRHGGRIWADSTEGEGSCFYFTLNVDEAVTEK